MSNWFKFVKAFSEKNKMSYKDAMVSTKCKNEYVKTKIKGGYLPANVKYVKTIIYGRDDYPPKVRNILKKYGNEVIVSYKLKRVPVSSFLKNALNIVSLGEFNKRYKESDYDQLFHLFLEMTTQSGKRISVEKNEVINMDVSPPTRPKEEVEDITSNIPQGLTINELMNNTKKRMGDTKFFNYSAKSSNCQDMIINILDANDIGDESNREFVKQDTDFLFENLPFLRKFSNTVTTLGARANVITEGAGFFKKKKKVLTTTSVLPTNESSSVVLPANESSSVVLSANESSSVDDDNTPIDLYYKRYKDDDENDINTVRRIRRDSLLRAEKSRAERNTPTYIKPKGKTYLSRYLSRMKPKYKPKISEREREKIESDNMAANDELELGKIRKLKMETIKKGLIAQEADYQNACRIGAEITRNRIAREAEEADLENARRIGSGLRKKSYKAIKKKKLK